jgi:hypothetical protein
MRNLLIVIFAITITLTAKSQNNRISTHQTIGWYGYFGTIKLKNKFSLHTEYQWRRENIITNWQQSLTRVGLNYQLKPNILLRAGYAYIETYAYGDIPLNAFGKNFTEHRLYQMAQLGHKEGIVNFTHRFILEQRFVGRYNNASSTTEDEYPLLHRLRYMARLQLPLKNKEIKNNTSYFAMYNEILIGFGKNVNANIFDQNRLGILLGYNVNKTYRVEGGYLSQIVQFGRQINNKNVFQYNNGIVINNYVNF